MFLRKAMMLSIFLCSVSVSAATWKIDDTHATIKFSVRHMMISDVEGKFNKFTGEMNYDPAQPSQGSVSFTIPAESIDTSVKKRDDHLKSPDFFDVAKFPNITFKSTKVEKKGEALMVTGDLSMHGVTKPVVFQINDVSQPVKNPWGKTIIAGRAETLIKRKDFGLSWNKTLDSGGVLVGEDVKIMINAEFVREE